MLTLSPNLKEVVRGGNENETHFPSISREIGVLISYPHIYLYACIFTHIIINILYLQQLDIAGYHETVNDNPRCRSQVHRDPDNGTGPECGVRGSEKFQSSSEMVYHFIDAKKTIIFGPMKKEDDFKILS